MRKQSCPTAAGKQPPLSQRNSRDCRRSASPNGALGTPVASSPPHDAERHILSSREKRPSSPRSQGATAHPVGSLRTCFASIHAPANCRSVHRSGRQQRSLFRPQVRPTPTASLDIQESRSKLGRVGIESGSFSQERNTAKTSWIRIGSGFFGQCVSLHTMPMAKTSAGHEWTIRQRKVFTLPDHGHNESSEASLVPDDLNREGRCIAAPACNGSSGCCHNRLAVIFWSEGITAAPRARPPAPEPQGPTAILARCRPDSR